MLEDTRIPFDLLPDPEGLPAPRADRVDRTDVKGVAVRTLTKWANGVARSPVGALKLFRSTPREGAADDADIPAPSQSFRPTPPRGGDASVP